MKYKLVLKGNPSQLSAPKKYYANPVNSGKVTVKDFAKEISSRSSLTCGDIKNVLTNFLDELPTFLKYGMSVQFICLYFNCKYKKTKAWTGWRG